MVEVMKINMEGLMEKKGSGGSRAGAVAEVREAVGAEPPKKPRRRASQPEATAEP